ncbi:MAG: tetratricopeptide repeat protein, partial [Cyanobacteria bacterium J06648_11]
EEFYQYSHERLIESVGTEHPDIARSLNNMAAFYRDINEFERAEALYEESIALWEHLLGTDHPALAGTLNSLGALYDDRGEYDRALPRYQRSLAIRQTAFGSEHPSVASSLNNMAGLQRAWGHYDRAAALYERSASIWKASFGSRHLHVADSLSNVAWVYQLQGQTATALDRLALSLETEERNLTSNLFRGSERDKYDYLNLFEGSTNGAVSFHLQQVSNRDRAARLALTTLLRRKGRVLDVLGESMTLLRQRLSPSDRDLLDRLTDIYQQMANLAASVQVNRDRLLELEMDAEIVQQQLLERNAEFRRAVEPVTIEAVRAEMPENAALVEFVKYRPIEPLAPAVSRLEQPRYAA